MGAWKQLQFSFHGSIELDGETVEMMVSEGYDPENAIDVAEWFGGRNQLIQFADVADYSVA